jgi:predicted helicase
MYTRFFRWASDRLHDDGILAFISNRSFIDSRTMDGFRRAVAAEYSDIYVVDLGGDVRANPKLSGTKNNVFGIQTGVAISFLIKRRAKKGEAHSCAIHYARRPEMETKDDKLEWLGQTKLSELPLDTVRPDAKANWINLTENDFESLIQIASKATKAAKTKGQERAIFGLFSLGVSTNRDEWIYGWTEKELETKIKFFCDILNLKNSKVQFFPSVKWSEALKRKVSAKKTEGYSFERIKRAQYRPFIKQFAYDSELLIDRRASVDKIAIDENRSICFLGNDTSKPFSALATTGFVDLNFLSPAAAGTKMAPFRRSGIDNITDWALKEFQKHYEQSAGASPLPLTGEGGPTKSGRVRASAKVQTSKSEPVSAPSSGFRPPSPAMREKDAPITRDAIFHYVYGVLHDPVYREKYAQNLKREFPRIPFYADFWLWAGWGERLMALHVGYESVAPWPLQRTDTIDKKARAAAQTPKVGLKSDHDNGIISLDSETQLSGVPKAAWDYRLGNRCALDWILDQHKEKKPKDPTIREKFNTYRFADHKEKVIDLLGRVTRVSVETMEIVEAMRALPR